MNLTEQSIGNILLEETNKVALVLAIDHAKVYFLVYENEIVQKWVKI